LKQDGIFAYKTAEYLYVLAQIVGNMIENFKKYGKEKLEW
jgi:hypothetical protein